MNDTTKQSLRPYINLQRNDWDEFINPTIFRINTNIHSSTHYSPYELLFGHKARLPYLENEDEVDYESYIQQTQDRMNYLHKEAKKNQENAKQK